MPILIATTQPNFSLGFIFRGIIIFQGIMANTRSMTPEYPNQPRVSRPLMTLLSADSVITVACQHTADGNAKDDIEGRVPAGSRHERVPGLLQRSAADPEEKGTESEKDVHGDDGEQEKGPHPAVRDSKQSNCKGRFAPRLAGDSKGRRTHPQRGQGIDRIH